MERAQPSPWIYLHVDMCVIFIYWEAQALLSPGRFLFKNSSYKHLSAWLPSSMKRIFCNLV